jgi:hypothetical protein
VLAYKTSVVLTDESVDIQGHGASVTWPRGAVIEFFVTNHGTRTYTFQVHLFGAHQFGPYEQRVSHIDTPPITPNHIGTVRVFFYYRDTFVLRALLDGKQHGKEAVVIIT